MNEKQTPRIVTSANGAVKVVDGPLTTPAIREASPALLTNEIDSRVVKVRPMATPVDQISRMVGARPASSMIVDYYSVDAKSVGTRLAAPLTKISGGEFGGHQTYVLKVADSDAIAVTETLMIPSVATGKGENRKPLVIYVVAAAKGTDTPSRPSASTPTTPSRRPPRSALRARKWCAWAAPPASSRCRRRSSRRCP